MHVPSWTLSLGELMGFLILKLYHFEFFFLSFFNFRKNTELNYMSVIVTVFHLWLQDTYSGVKLPGFNSQFFYE